LQGHPLVQTPLRFTAPILLGVVLGCVEVPDVVQDASLAQGKLADGTPVRASGAVFGGTVDDGTGTVPPLHAIFEVAAPHGNAGPPVALELRAPVSFVMPPRGSSEAVLCISGPDGGAAFEQCDLPTIEVQLDEDFADCGSSSYCTLAVGGRITIAQSSIFNGTVDFRHHEALTDTSIFGRCDPPNPAPE
jgi:hypothetical protein